MVALFVESETTVNVKVSLPSYFVSSTPVISIRPVVSPAAIETVEFSI